MERANPDLADCFLFYLAEQGFIIFQVSFLVHVKTGLTLTDNYISEAKKITILGLMALKKKLKKMPYIDIKALNSLYIIINPFLFTFI